MSTCVDTGALVDDLVARGVFRAEPLRAGRAGAAAWRITWFGGHAMRLQAGGDEVRIDGVLPPLPARSALYRELRGWLRAQQGPDLPAHRRLDPARFGLEVRNHGGQVTLRLRSELEPLPALADRAVQLVNALYHEFLGGPGRLDWVIEAFGLDPDRPRFS